MKKFITLFLFATLWASISVCQDLQIDRQRLPGFVPAIKKSGSVTDLSTYQSPKRPGHYTTEDWHALIDSLWGPGDLTTTKLSAFDNFWNKVDQTWGGFPNLDVNWDSLRSVYRPLVEAGVSRGRFAGILSCLTRALQEVHAGAIDTYIDFILGSYSGYPNCPLFHYLPGIPIININVWIFRTNFGAGLTLLQDNSIMVYSVMPNHPLDLQPGDIILGYDGIPWIQLLNDLFKAELPMLSTTSYGTMLGASTAAANHSAMMSVGMNWGLFDTIDVVKYSTNDTLHFATSLLAAIKQPYFVATEQLPVNGVPFPDIQRNKLVSWGIVEGTNIGYIYVWDWYGVPEGQTGILFGKAVDELMHVFNVNGLILDFRTNHGGNSSYANTGFKHLFNIDPTYNYSLAQRVAGNDHYAFTINPDNGAMFTPTAEVFDHPIAVLLGPNCFSAGDYNAFRLRFHPMARSFGKPTNGAYVCAPFVLESYSMYTWYMAGGCAYSNVNNEGYMIHKSFPVDEEVWLTQDGVAKGEDDVVKKAMEWIQNLSYAHNVLVNPDYFIPPAGTATLTAKVENPNGHNLSVNARITSTNNIITDTVSLFDDGNHDDGDPGDGIWGTTWPVPDMKTIFSAEVTTEDLTAGTSRSIPGAAKFTTIGPVVVDGITYRGIDTIPNSGDKLPFTMFLRNNDLTASVVNIQAKLTSLDTTLAKITPDFSIAFADMAPGETSSNYFKIAISEDCPSNTAIPVKVDISSDLYTFWSDTFSITVRAPVNTKDIRTPMTRIYPNPTADIINIEISNTGEQEIVIELVTVTGQVIYSKDYKNSKDHFVEQIDLSGYAKGVYFVRISQSGTVYNGKIIVL